MKHSKSALMLMELSIAILFFSLCAGVCLQLFAKAKSMSEGSVELAGAVAEVEMAAEKWLAGENGDTVAYYDSEWKTVRMDDKTAFYAVDVREYDEKSGDGMINAGISARTVNSDEDKAEGQIIYSLDLIKRDATR